MWKNRYKYEYKTSDPNLIITAVRSFPNLVDTVEKAVESYEVKKLQSDPILLDIKSDYAFHNGRNFIPLYFEDDVPKLKKLEAVKPLGKGWFWCIGYKNPNFTETNRSGSGNYNPPSHEQYVKWIEYWLENFHTEYSSITNFLFKQCVDSWVYENSKDMNEELKSRRFELVANKNLRVMSGMSGERFVKKDQFINYLEEMNKTNWFEFVFKAYR